jgi:hypothetical protein
MLHSIQSVVKVVAALAGASFLYASVFLYEPERGKIQNKLEEWWVRVADMRSSLLSVQVVFLGQLAIVAGRGFDRLFGKELFSHQAFYVSGAYSAAAFTVALAVERKLRPADRKALSSITDHPAIAFGLFLVLIILGSLPALLGPKFRVEDDRTTPYFMAVFFAWCILLFPAFGGITMQAYNEHFHAPHKWLNDILLLGLRNDTYSRSFVMFTLLLSALALASFLCDVAFVAMTRWSLRFVSRSHDITRMVAVIVTNAMLAVGLILAPFLLARPGWRPTQWDQRTLGVDFQKLMQFLSLCNSFDAVAASALILLVMVALVHRLLWPLVDRAFYALADLGIARRGKIFGALGLSLLGYAGWGLPALVERIVDKAL